MTETPMSPADLVATLVSQGQRQEHTLSDGSRTVWHTWGEGSPIVLLHGGAGSWTHWIRNIPALAQQHAVWAADLPGFGDSDRYREANDADGLWPAIAESIEQHIAPSGGGVHLVGFSFGSIVSGFLAAERPDLVRSLSLVGAAAIYGRVEKPLGMVSVRRVTDPEEARAAHRQNLLALMLQHERNLDDLALYLQEGNVMRDRMAGRKLANTTIQAELQTRWRCPVQGIWGRGDVLYDDSQFTRLPQVLSACDLRGVHLIDDAGHWVQYEGAEQVNEAVLKFVDLVEREASPPRA